MDDYFGVIMAGGGGTRLWPLSRREHPKQSLRLLGERTLFQMAVDRMEPLIPASRILVATTADQAGSLREQAPQIPQANYLIEPEPRGTASAIGLAALEVARRAPQGVMACLTADHRIGNVDAFRALLAAAYKAALAGNLITLGIHPTSAATGYGYIERAAPLEPIDGFQVFQVGSFKEKPAQAQAETYLASGRYDWNSGMFVWRAAVILEAIVHLMPELAAGLSVIEPALGSEKAAEVVGRVWAGLQSQTIDYGIMEKVHNAVVIAAGDLEWLDIGSWDRLFEALPSDGAGNLMLAKTLLQVDTRGSLILQSEELESDRLVAVLGVKDLIIIDTPDVLLVCSRNRAEDLRQLVGGLQGGDLERYL
jgi:mannose-1-phosphate guanylyltransferase